MVRSWNAWLYSSAKEVNRNSFTLSDGHLATSRPKDRGTESGQGTTGPPSPLLDLQGGPAPGGVTLSLPGLLHRLPTGPGGGGAFPSGPSRERSSGVGLVGPGSDRRSHPVAQSERLHPHESGQDHRQAGSGSGSGSHDPLCVQPPWTPLVPDHGLCHLPAGTVPDGCSEGEGHRSNLSAMSLPGSMGEMPGFSSERTTPGSGSRIKEIT